MRYKIIHHHHRAWPMPKNRLDCRVCPRCGTGVFGSDGQRDHDRDHEKRDEDMRQVVDVLTKISEHLGFTVTIADDDWSWSAEVTGTEGELEAAE